MRKSQFINGDDFEGSPSFNECIISFQSELPLSLKDAMNTFIESHPNWDKYRLINAALAGFLVQNGMESRSVTRQYISNMFSSNL